MAFIRIENVHKNYKNVPALRGVSLAFDEGCLTAILGPSGCGKTTLLRALAGFIGIDAGEIYFGDQRVTFLPPQERGRPRIRHVSDARPMEVRKWVKRQPASRWRRKTLRNTTKGRLVVEVLHERVWLWDKHSPTAHCWHLIVRREIDSPGTIKYCLSNAPEKTSLIKLVQMQAQRFWVERAFQDAKSHVGMAQYQARQWQSWHRHMALVMLTMQFMLQTRLEHVQTHPLLSCYDIQILLAKTLPDRRNSREEILRQLQIRHQQRQASIESAHSG